MNEKIIHRLFKYLNEKGIPPTRFEKIAGLSNGYLGLQLKREADLGESIINKIINNCLDMDALWLLTGKGFMFHSEQSTTQILAPSDSSIYQLYKEMEAKADRLLEENTSLKSEIRRFVEGDDFPKEFVPDVSTVNPPGKGSGAGSHRSAGSGESGKSKGL